MQRGDTDVVCFFSLNPRCTFVQVLVLSRDYERKADL